MIIILSIIISNEHCQYQFVLRSLANCHFVSVMKLQFFRKNIKAILNERDLCFDGRRPRNFTTRRTTKKTAERVYANKYYYAFCAYLSISLPSFSTTLLSIKIR